MAQFKDEPLLADLLAEEREDLDRTLEFAEQLLIVAFYRVIELATSRALGFRWGTKEVRKRQLFRVERLQEIFLSDLGQDLTALPGYAGVDELRCINNAFKHEGCVTAALAKFSGWVEGQPLGNGNQALERLSGQAGLYIDALLEAVIPK